MDTSNMLNIDSFLNLFGNQSQQQAEKVKMSDLVEKGYISFPNTDIAMPFLKKFGLNEWLSQKDKDEVRYYPAIDFLKGIDKIKNKKLSSLCALIRLYKVSEPLSLSLKKENDEQFSYVLSCFDKDMNNFKVLHMDTINVTSEEIIKVLPLLHEDMKVNEDLKITIDDKENLMAIENDTECGTLGFKNLNEEEQLSVKNYIIQAIIAKKDVVKPAPIYEEIPVVEEEEEIVEEEVEEDLSTMFNYPEHEDLEVQKQRIIDFMKKGYVIFENEEQALEFMRDPRYCYYELKNEDNEYRVYDTKGDYKGYNIYLNNQSASLFLATLFTNAYKHLTVLFEKKSVLNEDKEIDEMCYVSLSSYDSNENKYEIIGSYKFPVDVSLFIKIIPEVYVCLYRHNEVQLVLEQGNHFKMDSKYANNSILDFRGFNAYEQNQIIGMKKFCEVFASSDKDIEVPYENVILTGVDKSAKRNEIEAKDAKQVEDIKNSFISIYDQERCPLYVSITNRGDGYYKYKLEKYDNKKYCINSLYECTIHSLGSFVNDLLPFIVSELEQRGRLHKRVQSNSYDTTLLVFDAKERGCNQIILNNFTPSEVSSLRDSLYPNDEKVIARKKEEVWHPMKDSYNYRTKLTELIKKNGYVDLTYDEMIEFNFNSEYNYWSRSFVDGKFRVYPAAREILFYDKEINDSLAGNIVTEMRNIDSKVSLVVECLPDSTCVVKFNKYNEKENINEVIREVRVMFDGDFINNVLKLSSDLFNMRGHVEVLSFDLKDRNTSLSNLIYKDKNLILFYGLSDEQKEVVSNMLNTGVSKIFKM